MIGHIQTVIQVIFGEFDDDGDIVRKFPFTLEVAKLNNEQWAEALKTLEKIRDDLRAGRITQPQ